MQRDQQDSDSEQWRVSLFVNIGLVRRITLVVSYTGNATCRSDDFLQLLLFSSACYFVKVIER